MILAQVAPVTAGQDTFLFTAKSRMAITSVAISNKNAAAQVCLLRWTHNLDETSSDKQYTYVTVPLKDTVWVSVGITLEAAESIYCQTPVIGATGVNFIVFGELL